MRERFNLARQLSLDPRLARHFTGIMVAEWRRSTGLTQKQLAELLSTHPSSISEWENRKGPNPPRVAWQLAGVERAARRFLYQRRISQHSSDYRKRQRIRRERVKRGLPPEPAKKRVPLW